MSQHEKGGIPSAPMCEAPPPYAPPYQQVPGCPPYSAGVLPPQPMYPQFGYAPQLPHPYAPAGPAAYQHIPQQYPGFPPQQVMAVPMAAPQNHYVVTAEFDAGARFNQHSAPSIPPPPPGCAPNAAQLAMMSGQPATVIAQQKKGGLFSGSGSGGLKFW